MGFKELKQLSAHVSSLTSKLRLHFDYSKYDDTLDEKDDANKQTENSVDNFLVGEGNISVLHRTDGDQTEITKSQDFKDRVEVLI